jgi:hypothetical protein
MSLPLSYHSADARACTQRLFLRGILSHGRRHVLVTPFTIFLLLPSLARAQFATVIDIPAGTSVPALSSIDSNTQLNLFAGGSIGAGFSAGSPDGSSANVEVNLLGGVVGDDFNAYRGSVVNVSGGTIGSDFAAHEGSSVTIGGGTVKSIKATGSDVEITGGATDRIELRDGSELTLSGGTMKSLYVSNSSAHASIGPSSGFHLQNGSLTLTGGTVSSSAIYNGSILTLAGAQLTGYLHIISGSSVFLSAGSLGAIDRVISIVDRSALYVSGGVVAGDLSAGVHSAIHISGGVVGGHKIGDRYFTGRRLHANARSSIEISGGIVRSYVRIFDNCSLDMSGGSASDVTVLADGRVNVTGGSIDSLNVNANGVARVDGGMIGTLQLRGGLDLYGGSITSHLNAWSGSQVRIHATQFALDGVDITAQLLAGEPLTISERNVTLTGTYRDGSPFEILLSDSGFGVSKYFFSRQATISLALVPEIRSVSLLIISCTIFGLNSRRPRS